VNSIVDPSIFTLCDVRADDERLDEDTARTLATAFARQVRAEGETVVVGRDARQGSAALSAAVIDGLARGGANVCDIGLAPTEVAHWFALRNGWPGAISVTASHWPPQFLGLKFLLPEGQVLHGAALAALAHVRGGVDAGRGTVTRRSVVDEYVSFLTSLHAPADLRGTIVLADAACGAMSRYADALFAVLGVDVVRRCWRPGEAGGETHIVDPATPESRAEMRAAVLRSDADIGFAWDGDGDRCMVTDGDGQSIVSAHLAALLAVDEIRCASQRAIVHDVTFGPSLTVPARDAGARVVVTAVGNPFMKAAIRRNSACYAAEASGHHYFHALGGIDSGLLCAAKALLACARAEAGIAELVRPFREKYFVAEQETVKTTDPAGALHQARAVLGKPSSELDGLSYTTEESYLSLRASLSGGAVRVQVESTLGPNHLETLKDRACRSLDPAGSAALRGLR
jgi:phosphomannomutase